MSQLTVHRVEEKVVRKLKERADRDGISMEQEHRRILREALTGPKEERPPPEEFLSRLPDAVSEDLFEQSRLYI